MPSLHHVNADKPTLRGGGSGMTRACPVGAGRRTAAPFAYLSTWAYCSYLTGDGRVSVMLRVLGALRYERRRGSVAAVSSGRKGVPAAVRAFRRRHWESQGQAATVRRLRTR
ncbi:hypothetical protein J3F83DRAFT_738095 [Trichoderma novae-zelandiae]